MSPKGASSSSGWAWDPASVESRLSMILKERKGERERGGQKTGDGASSFTQESGAKLPRGPLHFPRVGRQYPPPPAHQFRFRVWVGWRGGGPRSIGAVISSGLLSEQKSEWALMEGVCVALYRKFHFVVGSSRESSLKKHTCHISPFREHPFCRLMFSLKCEKVRYR